MNDINRSSADLSLQPLVSSAELSFSFIVNQLKSEVVDILAVFKDKLLIGRKRSSQLFLSSQDGKCIKTFQLKNDGYIHASWTPRGNIVYTTSSSKRVTVMSKSGYIIKHTAMTEPQDISVSNGFIYLADAKAGIYQSTDDGISWNFVFKQSDGWLCRQVIKVTNDNSDEFWIQERGNIISRNAHLRIYSEADKQQTQHGFAARLKDISLKTPDGRKINLVDSRLLYDGYNNVYLNECDNKAVHLLSVNGQYHSQLLSPNHLKNQPYRLALDKGCRLLFVGQRWGVVEVFKLIYE